MGDDYRNRKEEDCREDKNRQERRLSSLRREIKESGLNLSDSDSDHRPGFEKRAPLNTIEAPNRRLSNN